MAITSRLCERTTQIAQAVFLEPTYDIPSDAGLISLPGEGKTLTLAGTAVTFKATQDNWTMMEMSLAPGFGGPIPHLHKIKTETYYVLEGQLVFMLEWQEMVLSAGAVVMVKPGAVHTYWNMGPGHVRMMVMASPTGTEGYYEAMAQLPDRERQWPPDNRAEFMAMMAQYDQYLVWE